MKHRSPAELRGVFGANLRQLGQSSASVSQLCRDLGINRTQFNRYLAGESFPRPDVLHRICNFFGVDARILLEPVDEIGGDPKGLLHHPYIADFVGGGLVVPIAEDEFPSGFYRFSRASFTDPDSFIVGLVQISRRDNFAFLRGFEPKAAMEMHGMSTDAPTREFRGLVMPQAEGLAILVSRRDSVTSSFNYLARIPALAKIYWVGYTLRTMPESPTTRRAARLVYEYLGHDMHQVLATARNAGYVTEDKLPTFHRKQLRIGEPFV
ncbi:helix-turn-helix domain-containing protein [Salipiger bermudensis]|uniref:helix-turn-helix domain-containing protein n=1 Tax=Salipiger bermudensis TaxID=344736 RepID=UPI001CD3C3C0|nr:helix-turn-helix transcriptional regulator [Salipiger bermudensis]MCA0961864.1 helix-turn-helix transcriptional regulator [Salipiger bermudensis]